MALTTYDAMFGARYHAAINERTMVLNLHNTLITNDFYEVNAAFLSMVFEARNYEAPC